MKIEISHSCEDFTSYRAERVKSLFNAETGYSWSHMAEIPIEDLSWKIGLIVGPSGSGKTSLGKRFFLQAKYMTFTKAGQTRRSSMLFHLQVTLIRLPDHCPQSVWVMCRHG